LNTESELASEADRAGRAVADQIAAMIDAARGAAVVIERRARDADEERRSADEQAARVLETLRRIESELMLLVSHVGREADALSATVERARLRSAAVVLGPTASSPVVVQEPEPEPEPEQEAKSEAEAEPEPAGDPDPEVTEAFEVATPIVKTSEPGSLEDEARSRVSGKSDLELAELHQIALGRSSVGSEDERRYWSALASAAVHEAVARTGFGKLSAAEDLAGRRARKKRAKALKPLMAAREQALRSPSS
jgi:hypothetical protein